MKRPHIFRTILLLGYAVVNLGLLGPAVAGAGPAVDPVTGLPPVLGPSPSPQLSALVASSAPWIKYDGNPVLDAGSPGSWDSYGVGLPSVLLKDGSYKMWYSATGPPDADYSIGLAESTDGVYWTRSPHNPVLTLGASGAWDSGYVIAPQVIYHDGIYKMWYRATPDSGSSFAANIGYATSNNGVDWVKYAGNPVLTVASPGAWDGENIWSVYIIVEGAAYKMWYSGGDGTNFRIGYATSPDGVTWTKYSGNPVMDVSPVGSWDSSFIYYPNIVFNGSAYEMWYSGSSAYDAFAIGHATSPDGLAWTRDSGNPVLSMGAPGSWESMVIIGPSVVVQGGTKRMWYMGRDASNIDRIGYATISLDIEPVYLPLILR